MKKQKMKRVLALILAFMMVLSAAACDEGGQSQAQPQPGSEGDGGAASGTTDANFNESGWPVVNEPVTLRVYGSRNTDQPEDWNDFELIKRMEETTGVQIEWELVEASAYDEKRSIMLASGDFPDVIKNGVSVTEMIKYGSEGAFLPLEELQEKYAPQFMAAYDKVEGLRGTNTMPDGHSYSFAVTGFAPFIGLSRIGAINTDWLDAVGMELPTTLDELKDVLIAFRDQDPNGNGEKDEIPLSWAGALNNNLAGGVGWGMGLNWLADAFGCPDPDTHLDVVDGTVTFVPTREEYKAFIIWLNELYNEGLIDPNGFSQATDQYRAKLTAETPVVGVASVWEIGDDFADYSAYDRYAYLSPLKGLDGEDPTPFFGPYDASAGHWVVTTACENPEIAVRVADYFYDQMISLEMLEGPIGVRMVDCTECDVEGAMMVADPPEGINTQTWRNQVCPAGLAPFFVENETYKQYQHLHYTDKKAEKIEDDIKPIADKDPVGKLNYTIEEADLVNQIQAEIMDYANRRTAEWVLNGKVEEEWDAYLQELENMNLSGWMEAAQNAQERFEAAG